MKAAGAGGATWPLRARSCHMQSQWGPTILLSGARVIEATVEAPPYRICLLPRANCR